MGEGRENSKEAGERSASPPYVPSFRKEKGGRTEMSQNVWRREKKKGNIF